MLLLRMLGAAKVLLALLSRYECVRVLGLGDEATLTPGVGGSAAHGGGTGDGIILGEACEACCDSELDR